MGLLSREENRQKTAEMQSVPLFSLALTFYGISTKNRFPSIGTGRPRTPFKQKGRETMTALAVASSHSKGGKSKTVKWRSCSTAFG